MLKAKIGTNDGKVYNVEFVKLNSETTDVEYVRMVLNFIAKMIHIISKKNEYERELIFEFLDEIVDKKMSSAEIIDLIELPVKCNKNQKSKKSIEATLYYKNIQIRNILTKIPISHFEYQFANSTFALIKHTLTSVQGIPERQLLNSLKIMRKRYLDVIDLDDPKVMVALPNEAYFESILETKITK